MMNNSQLFLFFLGFVAIIHALIPIAYSNARAYFLIGSSILFVYILVPHSFFIALFFTLLAWLLSFGINKYKSTYSNLMLYGLLVLGGLFFMLKAIPHMSLAYTIGINFIFLKTTAMFIIANSKGKPFPLKDSLLYNFFFPAYSAGPVIYRGTFFYEPDKKLIIENIFYGLGRVVLGFFKTIFLADTIISYFLQNSGTISGSSQLNSMVFIVFSFFYTYTNFSGYSDIAIGSALCFNIKIPENFNFPILAGNISEFWRRWHISLGNWVTQFLFFPFASFLKNYKQAIPIALFFSFLLVGIWHKLNFNYLFWGVLHGTALALRYIYYNYLKGNQFYQRLCKNFIYKILCWIMTILFVAYVQAFANLETLTEGIGLTRKLIGI